MSESLFEPWDTPAHWEWLTLGRVCKVMRAGGTPSAKNASFYGGEIPFAKVEDIVDSLGRLSATNHTLTSAGLDASSAWMVPSGSVLYTMYASYGVASINAIPVATNQAVIALRPSEEVASAKFLYWYLSHIKPRIAGKAVGTTQDNLSKRLVADFPFPVPPLMEQARIVAKVDELSSDIDAGVRSIGEVGRLLPATHASLLDAAFSGLLSGEELDAASGLPCGWRWTTLGDASLTEIEAGLTKNPKRESLLSRLPYLRVANVYKNELRLDEIKTIGVTEAEARQKALRAGDLLVVEGNGSRDQIGRVALWDGSIAPVVHQNHIIRVRFGDAVNPHFALYWLMSARGRSAVVERASTTSGLYTLSKSKVASLPLPMTDRVTQDRIVAVVDAELSRLAAAGRYVTDAGRRSEALRQSVLSAAFSGQLI